jgi:CheY-like chemotaxis protein
VHFLVAEDQEEVRDLTTYLLERDGHTVVQAANGSAALDEFRRHKFDVILLDEEMPKMTGVQVLRAIREQQQNRSFRSLLIALTGNNSDQDRQRLLAEGFDAVLGKPFSIGTLNALLRSAPDLLSFGVRSPADGEQPAFPEKTPLERVGGDEKLLRQMIRTFLRDNPKRMSAMTKSISRKDSYALASFAHTVRGSISIFTTSKTLELLNQIQIAAREKDFATAVCHYTVFKEDIANLEANLRRYAKLPKVKPRAKKR